MMFYDITRERASLSAKWLQDDFKMVVKTAFKISVNRCKNYTYNDFSLYISLHSDGSRVNQQVQNYNILL